MCSFEFELCLIRNERRWKQFLNEKVKRFWEVFLFFSFFSLKLIYRRTLQGWLFFSLIKNKQKLLGTELTPRPPPPFTFSEKIYDDPLPFLIGPPFINFLVFSEENNIFVMRFEILKKQPPVVFLKIQRKTPAFWIVFISHLELIIHFNFEFTRSYFWSWKICSHVTSALFPLSTYYNFVDT